MIEAPEVHHVAQPATSEQDVKKKRLSLWTRWLEQFIRFGMVGGLNTTLDFLIFNSLLWLFPTTNILTTLMFNSLAYSTGAVNSFFLNKYWTFEHQRRITLREVSRFVITTLLGVGCNDFLLWLANALFSPMIAHSALWLNASKVAAIAGTVFVSYIGMRLWVFANKPQANTYVTRKSKTSSTYTEI